MHYWNKSNFEGLKTIGEKYISLPNYELFGNYCLQKERGLKKLAITSIQQFISLSRHLPLQQQRKIAEELASLCYVNRHIHQLLAHPLTIYIKEVLTLWIVDEANNPSPHKWLGYLDGDTALYEKVLQLDPSDEFCIYHIAQAHLNNIDYQTHHLSESLFIGDISQAKHSLQLVTNLITRLTTATLQSKIQNDLAYFNKLLNCWAEYSKLNIDDDFPKWCAAKGEEFNFWSVVYYDK